MTLRSSPTPRDGSLLRATVGVAMLLALAGCSDGAPTVTPITTSAQVPAAAGGSRQFTDPTGSVLCDVGADKVTCDLPSAYKDINDECSSVQGARPVGVQLAPESSFVCKAAPTVIASAAATSWAPSNVPHKQVNGVSVPAPTTGQSVVKGPFACEVTSSGDVSCAHFGADRRDDHRFELPVNGDQVLFPDPQGATQPSE